MWASITVSERAVATIAACAALEEPDAGAVGSRVFGRPVPGSRGADPFSTRPKCSVEVEGTRAFVTLDIAVRYPASVGAVARSVRQRIRDRVHDYVGMTVERIELTVTDFVVDVPNGRRVQ